MYHTGLAGQGGYEQREISGIGVYDVKFTKKQENFFKEYFEIHSTIKQNIQE